MFRALSPSEERGFLHSATLVIWPPHVERLLCTGCFLSWKTEGPLFLLVGTPRFWTVSGGRAGELLWSVSLLPRPWQVMLVIDAAVTNVEDLSSLEEYLAGLGRKHRAVGVKLSSFSVGKGALPVSGAPGLRPPLSPRPPHLPVYPPHSHTFK